MYPWSSGCGCGLCCLPQTGKTHTLIELIFQLLSRPASATTSQPPRILVTTPSNLALDNLLLRLHALSKLPEYASLLPPGSFVRLGHPTRVHRDLVHETLDWRAANGEDGALVRDVGKEIQGHLGDLGKKRGEKGAVKGRDRGKKWEEVRALRKEWVWVSVLMKIPAARDQGCHECGQGCARDSGHLPLCGREADQQHGV